MGDSVTFLAREWTEKPRFIRVKNKKEPEKCNTTLMKCYQ
jgi:hypothetical protein